MKLRKTIYVLLLFIIICLCGCSNSSDNVIEEVNIQETNKDAQIFIEKINDSNRIYLFSPINKEQRVGNSNTNESASNHSLKKQFTKEKIT